MSNPSVHADLRATNDPGHLPYEIFLLIVDAMISEAYEKARHEKVTYILQYRIIWNRDVPDKQVYISVDSPGYETQKWRLNQIRTFLQIDRTSRRMVERVFVPTDLWSYLYNQPMRGLWHDHKVSGCVLPDVDIFEAMPTLEMTPPDRDLRSTILHPSTEEKDFFRLIRRVQGDLDDFVPSSDFWRPGFTPEALRSFPNLKEIRLKAEQNFARLDPRVSFHYSHEHDMPIDTQIFPLLENWKSRYGEALETHLRVAEEREVPCFIMTGKFWRPQIKKARLLLKDGAVRMQFVNPGCDCYYQLYSDLNARGVTLESVMQQQE
ncbi:hypothetical protein CORC01_00374 [Colletotrichum orchidophilum]|uniref:Uncharacterized protein n=1 Tax=Colletotrichum orchidophilum TaxID=1209926 RepID=A0A1G4BSV4_9PEZI|nr:uncharacterized protein CORC01_00374 [Colletotrichum orchidophilum]OHF04522.1 hypothetical protein CORC01_00374 [Colletotrichum orchidophilum]